MIVSTFSQPQFDLNVRSCYRCGAEFMAPGERVRVCQSCRRPPKVPRPEVIPGQKLSPRERQVAALVAQGLPNKLIAAELHLSEGTIKVYLFNIFRKTRVANRTELAVWQLRAGVS